MNLQFGTLVTVQFFILFKSINWEKVLNNGRSEICLSRPYSFNFLNFLNPQILHGLFLNTLINYSCDTFCNFVAAPDYRLLLWLWWCLWFVKWSKLMSLIVCALFHHSRKIYFMYSILFETLWMKIWKISITK